MCVYVAVNGVPYCIEQMLSTLSYTLEEKCFCLKKSPHLGKEKEAGFLAFKSSHPTGLA